MSIARVGIVGAGQMGRGIAQVAAAAGLEVVLVDAGAALAEKGRATVLAALDRLVDKGKLTAADREATARRIRTGDGVAALAEVDFAVEAATENPALKQQIFADLDGACPPGA